MSSSGVTEYGTRDCTKVCTSCSRIRPAPRLRATVAAPSRTSTANAIRLSVNACRKRRASVLSAGQPVRAKCTWMLRRNSAAVASLYCSYAATLRSAMARSSFKAWGVLAGVVAAESSVCRSSKPLSIRRWPAARAAVSARRSWSSELASSRSARASTASADKGTALGGTSAAETVAAPRATASALAWRHSPRAASTCFKLRAARASEVSGVPYITSSRRAAVAWHLGSRSPSRARIGSSRAAVSDGRAAIGRGAGAGVASGAGFWQPERTTTIKRRSHFTGRFYQVRPRAEHTPCSVCWRPHP
ncbi:MAG: hypothetical protein ACI9WU_001282 [Myxococcota bacterium]|jgi:hypothetical protein